MKLIFTLESGEELSFNVYERSVTIGRSMNCRIVLPYEVFSRHHCLIEFIDEQIIITDTGSSNGVFIDGQRIPTQVPTPYRLKEKLVIGNAPVRILEEHSSPEVPVELLMSEHVKKPSSDDSNLFQVRGRKDTVLASATITQRLPQKRIRYRPPKKQLHKKDEDTESFSLFDPVGIIVIVVMLSGFMFYRHKMNRVVKKAPPPYHKTYMVLED